MSKKDKAKFRRRIKAQILQEMSQGQRTQKPVTPLPEKVTTSPSQNLPATPVAPTTAIAMPDESLNHIKKDLKKSAIIISSIIILIIALAIIDSKINLLLRSGDQVFRILHIG